MLPTRVKPMETSPRACSTGVPAIAPALAPVGDPYAAAHDLIGYGACGIAVADLDETGQPNPTPEILVTTLNGEFVVFAQTGGVIDPTPRFHTIVDGQLGAFNSIVVGDFDPCNLPEPGDLHREHDRNPEVLCAVISMTKRGSARVGCMLGRGIERTAVLLVAGLGSVVCGPAQSTWVVDLASAPGSQFTQIQPAIDAASAGDLIVVRPGSGFYNGFTSTKGVSIICELRGWAIGCTSDIIVRGVPAGERCVLKRFGGYYTASLILEDNAGQVVIEKCQPGSQGGCLSIRNCAEVALNEVAPLETRIEGSFVTVNRGLNDTRVGPDPGVVVTRSVVVFGNTALLGCRANYNGASCTLISPPGVAISGSDSVLVLGAGTRILGGRLGVSGGACPPISIESNAIEGANMVVLRDPAASLGRVGPGVTVQTASQPTLDGIVGDELHGRMDFDLLGSPGSIGALVASLPGDPVLTNLGFQWADLNTYFVADLAAIDPMGHHRVSFTMPTAYPLGQPMVFQSLVLDAGSLVWSTPSLIVRN